MPLDVSMEETVAACQSYWQCLNYPELLQHEWEDEFFVFNPASGDTHVLNALSMEIVSLLSKDSLTLDSLVDRLTRGLENADQQQMYDRIGQHLLQLDGMGLLTPSSVDT